jgi:hypothetical protein
MSFVDPNLEERERILGSLPESLRNPSPEALTKGYDDRVRAHGRIPDATVADWKRQVTDESYPYAHRAMIWRTGKDALARVGIDWDVPEPTAASARGKQ